MPKSSSTARSVAYGWTGLTVATIVGFYFAKKEIDSRRRERPGRHVVITETSKPKVMSTSTAGTDPDPGRTPLNTTSPGVRLDAKMHSNPTGVDTTAGSADSQGDR